MLLWRAGGGQWWWFRKEFFDLNLDFDVGKMLGFEVNGQERILELSLVQKGGSIKARGRDPWVERAALGL